MEKTGAYEAEGFCFSKGQLKYLMVKQVLDVLFGMLFGLLLLPISYVIIKCICLLEGDTAPIIYRQERIGKGGKPFILYKYRSMVADADTRLQDVLKDAASQQEWEESRKLTRDPRVTRLGVFLRRSSVDELPQLMNVLKGDMSLIGPRPLVSGELEAYGGKSLYHMVKPGITGWWGCNGRSAVTYQERLELEYHYVRNISLGLDLRCIFRTIGALLSGRGAE